MKHRNKKTTWSSCAYFLRPLPHVGTLSICNGSVYLALLQENNAISADVDGDSSQEHIGDCKLQAVISMPHEGCLLPPGSRRLLEERANKPNHTLGEQETPEVLNWLTPISSDSPSDKWGLCPKLEQQCATFLQKADKVGSFIDAFWAI